MLPQGMWHSIEMKKIVPRSIMNKIYEFYFEVIPCGIYRRKKGCLFTSIFCTKPSIWESTEFIAVAAIANSTMWECRLNLLVYYISFGWDVNGFDVCARMCLCMYLWQSRIHKHRQSVWSHIQCQLWIETHMTISLWRLIEISFVLTRSLKFILKVFVPFFWIWNTNQNACAK